MNLNDIVVSEVMNYSANKNIFPVFSTSIQMDKSIWSLKVLKLTSVLYKK